MHVLRRSTYLIIDQLGAKVWAQSAFPSPKTVQLIMNDLAKFIILHHTLYYMTGFIDDISRFKSTFFMELSQNTARWAILRCPSTCTVTIFLISEFSISLHYRAMGNVHMWTLLANLLIMNEIQVITGQY